MDTFPSVVAAEVGGLRGALTAVGTLAVVGCCFVAVELLDRRNRVSATSTSPQAPAEAEAPIDDVWPLHRAGGAPPRAHSDRTRSIVASVVGPAVAVLVTIVLVPVRAEIGLASVTLLLVLVVVGAAAFGGRLAAALTSATGALAFNFFHTTPLHSFHIARPSNVATTVVMIVVGVAVGELARRGGRIPPRTRSTP